MYSLLSVHDKAESGRPASMYSNTPDAFRNVELFEYAGVHFGCSSLSSQYFLAADTDFALYQYS